MRRPGEVSEQPFLSWGGWISQVRPSLRDSVVVYILSFWPPIQHLGGFPPKQTRLWEQFSLEFLYSCLVAFEIGAVKEEDYILTARVVAWAQSCWAVKVGLTGHQNLIQMEEHENSHKQALFIFWTTIQNQEHPKRL